jgi:hypothetical protein
MVVKCILKLSSPYSAHSSARFGKFLYCSLLVNVQADCILRRRERPLCVGNIYLVIQKTRGSTNQSNVIIDHILRLGTTTTFHSIFIIHHYRSKEKRFPRSHRQRSTLSRLSHRLRGVEVVRPLVLLLTMCTKQTRKESIETTRTTPTKSKESTDGNPTFYLLFLIVSNILVIYGESILLCRDFDFIVYVGGVRVHH